MGRPSASDDAERKGDDIDEDGEKIAEYDRYGEDEAVGDTLRYSRN